MKGSLKVDRWALVASIWGIICVQCLAQTSPPPPQVSQKSETLEQRVARGDPYAFLEAADAHRKDLIPALEEFSGDPTAKKAMAKLGVKKYVDEIILEAANPTNSPAYKERVKSFGYQSRFSELCVQTGAFEKLEYIKDRSTVRVLASFLYGKENPEDYIIGGDVTFNPPSEMAMKLLAQIVDNPPQIKMPDTYDTHDARIKIWQQWWEKNKDKYP